MGMELSRKRNGQHVMTKMSEQQLREFAKKPIKKKRKKHRHKKRKM